MHRPKEHVMETLGDRTFATQVPAEWIYRKIEMDYGLDREIEIVDEENVTGKKLLVQIKTTESPDIADARVRFRLTTDKLEYYSRSDLPVLLVLVDLRTKICYWLFLHEYVEELKTVKPSWRQEQTINLEIPAANVWQECIDRIRQVAFKGPEFIALKKLSVSPDLAKISTGMTPEQVRRLQNNIENLSFTSFCGISNIRIQSEITPLGVEAQYAVRTYFWVTSRTWTSRSKPAENTFGQTMLTGSTEDLMFAVNSTFPFSDMLAQTGTSNDILQILGIRRPESYDTVLIYLPPGFTLNESSVVTPHVSPNIQVLRLSPFDIYAPGWTVVCVAANQNSLSGSQVGSDTENLRTFDRDYYVRLKHVTAPQISGKYFFKIALLQRNGEPVPRSKRYVTTSTDLGVRRSSFVRSDNWPILVVKGEVTPSIITGTLRYGDLASPPLRGGPIKEAGRVYARMTNRLDPYTSQERPDLPRIDAVGYFSPAALGHYELHGVAPGIYDIYAQAAGYPISIIVSNVKVEKGASLQFDECLQPGPVIHGEVLAQNKLVNVPWINDAEVMVQIFDSPTRQLIPDPSSRQVSWSPRVPTEQNLQDSKRGPQDVGPPQEWIVHRGATAPFRFEYGVTGEFGAPRDLDGMVSQIYATWVNGLTPGIYYVRASISDYAQTDARGQFLDYRFVVKPQEWAAELELQIRLQELEPIRRLARENADIALSDLRKSIDTNRKLILESFTASEVRLHVAISIDQLATSTVDDWLVGDLPAPPTTEEVIELVNGWIKDGLQLMSPYKTLSWASELSSKHPEIVEQCLHTILAKKYRQFPFS
ncbi:MAG: DUF4365 domain-containing protein [Candidatus Bathyarchaeia archaeon]